MRLIVGGKVKIACEQDMKDIVEQTKLKHIAIIMDGNRRWAK